MRFLFSFLIVLSLLIAPAMAQAADSCFSANCSVSVDVSKNKETASKSQPDSKKTVKADHCCACGGCHTIFSAFLSGANGVEHSQQQPMMAAASLAGLGPQSPLEPPRTI
ncbi:MAG: hypothetical protein EYC62_00815 [Alphaproteobacteria bacterium]|nr:MAG: hypothetical protein EYC62_00815 [Alphaproteobacteria bacterium]